MDAALDATNRTFIKVSELWDARAAQAGASGQAVLVGGFRAQDGPVWNAENPKRIAAWQGHIANVLGTGPPVVEQGAPGQLAGYAAMVAPPIHHGDAVAHVAA